MEETLVLKLIELGVSPLTLTLVAWLLYRQLSKDLEKFRNEFLEFKEDVHNNGFVRREILEEKVRTANLIHDRIDGDIRDLRERLHDIELRNIQ